MKKSFPVSDHFDGQHFHNLTPTEDRGLIDVLRWKMQGAQKTWKPQERRPKPKLATVIPPGEIHITSIGHITHLIQAPGLNIMTDPVFSERASPLKFAGPKRALPPALEISELPEIHAVVVSHNHYDHMDFDSLKELHQRFKPEIVVPLGNAHYLASIAQAKELDWWQTSNGRINVTCVPAQHWSSRTGFDKNRALWCGFVIEIEGTKIYFAGDSGYGPHFKMIRDRVGIPDVSILPIGAYEPRWFMKDQHMNPEDAVKAHQDLESRHSIGTHFGTFQLTDEDIHEPREKLQAALEKWKVEKEKFVAPLVGETVVIRTSDRRPV